MGFLGLGLGGRRLDGFTVSGWRADVPQRKEDTPKAARFL